MSRIADAYATVEKVSTSGRQLEASALFRAARALQAVQDQWEAPDRERRLDEALKLNQRLWTFFQTELASDDNPLPRDLKVQLLNLIEFIDKRTFDVMAFPTAAKLRVLIDINRNVAAGLSAAPTGVAA
ncbi:MAG: flagellar biosynthesis regulator FlaF [Gemmatimonadales bacterium]|nr:flagellar biosynthesis regulator FlaF [Gemmatimonadales bacterium]